jgi:hypothetical protein
MDLILKWRLATVMIAIWKIAQRGMSWRGWEEGCWRPSITKSTTIRPGKANTSRSPYLTSYSPCKSVGLGEGTATSKFRPMMSDASVTAFHNDASTIRISSSYTLLISPNHDRRSSPSSPLSSRSPFSLCLQRPHRHLSWELMAFY